MLKINLQVDFMKIIPIFGECLYAIKYDNEAKDEFSRLFELWNDPEYLEFFFTEHYDDLNSGFWKITQIFEAMFETYEYASELEGKLLTLSGKKISEQKAGLEMLFKPLHNLQSNVYTLGLSKAKATWLRIYALRIEKDVYLITGGAIKLTLQMEVRAHTNEELKKLERCREYLKNRGIFDRDGLIDELET